MTGVAELTQAVYSVLPLPKSQLCEALEKSLLQVLNRGVERRDVYLSESDRVTFP